jgi:hypothetical protein
VTETGKKRGFQKKNGGISKWPAPIPKTTIFNGFAYIFCKNRAIV